jgi:hypothetical protein
VPEGSAIQVTLDHGLASNQNKSGDEFEATVSAPVVIDGKTVIPKGSRAVGWWSKRRNPDVYTASRG